MRFTITWIFPFVAGLMTYHFIFTHDQEVVKAAEHKKRAPTAIPQPQESLTVPKLALKPSAPVTNPNLQPKPKQTVSLNLSESAIAQMEDSWNDLPQLAEAKREDRGWRMTRVTGNSPFFKAGLREGDLITLEFLDRLRNSNSQLVVRMEQILNRITR